MFQQVRGFWNRHSHELFVTLLLLWVVLLIVGTIAEVFDIAWILNWPLWSPPGKVG